MVGSAVVQKDAVVAAVRWLELGGEVPQPLSATDATAKAANVARSVPALRPEPFFHEVPQRPRFMQLTTVI